MPWVGGAAGGRAAAELVFGLGVPLSQPEWRKRERRLRGDAGGGVGWGRVKIIGLPRSAGGGGSSRWMSERSWKQALGGGGDGVDILGYIGV